MPFTDPVKWLKEHYKDSPLVLFAIEKNADFTVSLDELKGLLKAYALSQCTCERRRRERGLRDGYCPPKPENFRPPKPVRPPKPLK